MKYHYGTDDSCFNGRSRTCSATQLASIIKRDVEAGKWNKYWGGVTNSWTAHCEYYRRGFQYHERLYIYGNRNEFEKLESLIKEFIEVIPRKYE